MNRALIEVKGMLSHKVNNILFTRIEGLKTMGITDIDIAIESSGGCSEAGIEAFEFFNSYNNKGNININTINLFTCASAAVLYFLGGKKKSAMVGSNLTIHQGKFSLNGVYTQGELAEQLRMLENINNRYASIIESNLDINRKEYDEGISLSADELLTRGVASKIDFLDSDYSKTIFIFTDNQGNSFVDNDII